VCMYCPLYLLDLTSILTVVELWSILSEAVGIPFVFIGSAIDTMCVCTVH
jgi:hypothetical protein